DFPASFKRLEQNIRERLEEFRDYSDGMVEYEFIDPYASADEKTQSDMEQTLYEEGLRFTRLSIDAKGGREYQTIWPGAIIEYKGKQIPVQFFKSELSQPSEWMVNSSVNALEYELASNLRKLTRDKKPAIAFLQGHGELAEIELADLASGLDESYDVDFVTLDGQLNILTDRLEGMEGRVNKFDALVIAKPDSVFSHKDRIIIDQFVMNGGRVLWMIDPLLTDLDSLRTAQQTMAVSNEMKLYEMLYEYGCRLNRSMILDAQCALIALDAGPMGNQRNVQMFDWYYSPLLMAGDTAHPIVANLDPVFTEFVSSLDTVGENPDIEKTSLFYSSVNSKEFKAPVRVNSAVVNLRPDYFEGGERHIMALLMEGIFPSAMAELMPDTLKKDPAFAYRASSEETAMIVIADGDVARNKVQDSKDGPVPVPLGFDRYAGRVIYDNKEFLLNCMNYLLDDKSIISVRSRTIELRKLDGARIEEERGWWQMVNTVFPLLIVALSGAVLLWWRKRKYSAAKS
ncbi:MAG: gliding motility-associated ABC transporter substrate-binding protein GldG, partial [Flavobacteriales bacterium]|nr:gliding motility-associated ABC transporter substrate-binding protein GldG [Flavobacteriales bacterium]